MNFVKTHWKKLSVLLLLCVAFGLGWATGQRAPVEEKRETVAVEKTKEKVEEKTEEKKSEETKAAEVKHVIVYRNIVTKPDGTVHDQSVETTDTTNVRVETKIEEKLVEKIVYRDVEKLVKATVTITPALPTWRGGVDVGIVPSRFNLTNVPDMLRVGVSGERRILKTSAFVKASVMTSPTRPLQDVSVHVGITVEWK